MKNSKKSALTTSHRIIIISIALLLLGVFIYWWSTLFTTKPEPIGDFPEVYDTYTGFGFSFNHPKGTVFHEGVLLNGFDHARPFYGDVKGVQMNSLEIVGVYWNFSGEDPNLISSLDNTLKAIITTGDVRNLSKSSAESINIGKYEIVTQTVEFSSIEGTSWKGSVGSWYNKKEKRIYSLYNFLPSTLALRTDISERFQDYILSFDSQGWEPNSGELEVYWPTEGWRYAPPEAVALNASSLDHMIETIKKENIGVDSILIIRDGYIVVDAYFPPFNEGDLHSIYSCTKSVVSTLVGIALEEGYIESIEQRITDLYYDREIAYMSPWKREITLENLLTMTAGFDARDSWIYEWEWLGRMLASIDAQQYVLDLPVIEEPGTRFEYTNAVSHLLSCIITETTGSSALEYAEVKLFEPLGIHETEWLEDSKGRNWGWSTLSMTPKDMAKIGYLFLKKGRWDDEIIISENWVEKATSIQVDGNILPGYGYQWWVNPGEYYTALGYGGQFIHVVPDSQLVVVTTSGNPEDFSDIFSILEEYILPSVIQ